MYDKYIFPKTTICVETILMDYGVDPKPEWERLCTIEPKLIDLFNIAILMLVTATIGGRLAK